MLFRKDHNNCDICNVCSVPESVRHILFECSIAREIWLLFGISIRNQFTVIDVLIGYIKGLKKDSNLFLHILSTEILCYIWKIRNEDKFHGIGRALTESFHGLTLHHICLQVSMTVNIDKHKFLRFIKDENAKMYLHEMENGYKWRQTVGGKWDVDLAMESLGLEDAKVRDPIKD